MLDRKSLRVDCLRKPVFKRIHNFLMGQSSNLFISLTGQMDTEHKIFHDLSGSRNVGISDLLIKESLSVVVEIILIYLGIAFVNYLQLAALVDCRVVQVDLKVNCFAGVKVVLSEGN